VWMGREASGLGDLIRERERIDRHPKAAAEEVCDLAVHGAASVALQAAVLLVTAKAARTRPRLSRPFWSSPRTKRRHSREQNLSRG
jgi:hypothetical protein